jgi:isoleucyl-tRNA synthetase
MLSLLAELDAKLARAVDDFDFNAYTRALADFCNEDLSAFYFDIRKDRLYCDVNVATGYQTPERAAYRSVLDTLFHALIRYAAPVLVFTAEEVWGTRYPDAGSVHLLEWPTLPDFASLRHPRESGDPEQASADPTLGSRLRGNTQLVEKWKAIRIIRNAINEAIEPLRREKQIRSSLEAVVELPMHTTHDGQFDGVDWSEITITASVSLKAPISDYNGPVTVTRTTHHKCGRCWRHLPEVTTDGALCNRCETVLDA